ncbi:hypothetical protein K435DRAFT_37323 [Dendrothele bispora CBS 962.96]|uniref:Uncharacterized protein n=1 Tax=Dendrothele bispora (strain CBS 962.96) TaxID=1314807 RepID=A0A4S8KT72_DENBC|nr:hypothetical protein K435DRAFT_37323 [Dendrothele bispora CBS 962.96]
MVSVPAHSPSITPTSTLPTPPHSALHSHSGLRETSPVNATVSAPAPASKGKLWKLMKRLSTGGLRDKYYYGPESSSSSSPSPASPFFSQSPNEVPPPVPALPKDIPGYKANYGPARSSLSTIATASGSPVASGRQSRASSAHTNTSASSSKNPVPTAPGGIRMPPPLPPLSSMTRPGTGGTRSSSPISSDKGSSKFFNKTQSRRSSSSSYGEELPPPRLPTSNANSSSGSLGTSGSGGSSAAKSSLLQQHIIPPSELYKLQLSLETENASAFSAGPSSSAAHTPKNSLGGKSKRGDDYMIVCSPAEERPAFSLPVPPDWRGARNRERDVEDSMMRRPPLSEDGRPPSPIIPVFSTEGAINTWNKPKKKSESGRSQGSSRPTDAAMGEVFPNGRRSMSNPRTQVSTSPSSPTPPLPLRTSRRPSTANSGLSSNGSSRITSPARSPRIYPEKVQNHEDISTPILPRIPSSPSHPTRKSIGVIPPSPSRSEVTMGSTQSLTRVPSTPVSRVVSPSASTPRSTSTSTAPWDSPSLLYSPDSSSVLSDSPAPSKRSWGLPRGWKTSLSEREKAEKWDDLLQRSERAGGTLHIGSGSGLLSDQYPNEEG